MDISQFFDSQSLSELDAPLTILSLLIAVYTALRVSNVARWIRDDRNAAQGFQNPVDIYFSIQKAEKLIEYLQQRWMLRGEELDEVNSTLRGLRTSAAFLANYFYFVDGPQFLEANAFLAAGRFFWARRDPEKARDFFRKTLEIDDHSLTQLEREECVAGLLACNYLLWDFHGVEWVQRAAKAKGIEISSRYNTGLLIFLRCLRESAADALKYLLLRLHRGKKGGAKTLRNL